MKLDSYKTIFFLGIGGIGVSAIAQYMLKQGKTVYGYDKVLGDITTDLADKGAIITDDENYDVSGLNIDLVIYTPAIPIDLPILKYFETTDIPMIKRAKALGLISENKYTIAISGSHGKTTVSTMVSVLLKESGINCTAFMGGISANYNSNYVEGDSEYMVIEADEYDRSFLQLYPNIIVITAIDSDHLEIYDTRENLVFTFQEFINQSKSPSHIFTSDHVKDNLNYPEKHSSYGFDKSADNYIDIVSIEPNHNQFTVSGFTETYTLNYNGLHNIENAVAALSVGKALNISESNMVAALKKYKGVKRRFEIIYEGEKGVFIDDYAHHPSEISALIQSVKNIYPDKNVTVVFQPHLFTRTRDLAVDFGKSLSDADNVYLLPIYPAREKPIEGVTSDVIAKNVTSNVKQVEKEALNDELKKNPTDILVTVGAGDIGLLVNEIKKELYG